MAFLNQEKSIPSILDGQSKRSSHYKRAWGKGKSRKRKNGKRRKSGKKGKRRKKRVKAEKRVKGEKKSKKRKNMLFKLYD